MTCFLFTTNLSPLALACHPFSNILAPLIVQAFLEVKLTDQLKQTVTLFSPWIWPKGSEVIIIPIHKKFGITLFWKTSHSCCTQIIQIYWEVAKFFFSGERWVDNSKQEEALDMLRIPQTFSRNKEVKCFTDNFILLWCLPSFPLYKAVIARHPLSGLHVRFINFVDSLPFYGSV